MIVAYRENVCFIQWKPFRIGDEAHRLSISFIIQIAVMLLVQRNLTRYSWPLFIVASVWFFYRRMRRLPPTRLLRADEAPLTAEIHFIFKQMQAKPPEVIYAHHRSGIPEWSEEGAFPWLYQRGGNDEW